MSWGNSNFGSTPWGTASAPSTNSVSVSVDGLVMLNQSVSTSLDIYLQQDIHVLFDSPLGDPVVHDEISIVRDTSTLLNPTLDFQKAGVEVFDIVEVVDGPNSGLYLVDDVGINFLSVNEVFPIGGSAEIKIRKSLDETSSKILRVVFDFD